MRRFPNEIAVQAMFVKVCARYAETTKDGKPYVPLTDYEIEQLMEKTLGPRPQNEYTTSTANSSGELYSNPR